MHTRHTHIERKVRTGVLKLFNIKAPSAYSECKATCILYEYNRTNIINVKVCEDGRLFHFHIKTTERNVMKLYYWLYIRIVYRQLM